MLDGMEREKSLSHEILSWLALFKKRSVKQFWSHKFLFRNEILISVKTPRSFTNFSTCKKANERLPSNTLFPSESSMLLANKALAKRVH